MSEAVPIEPSPAPDLVCPACTRPIGPGAAVAVRHGEVFHFDCIPQGGNMLQPDQRSGEAQTRAEESIERAARLVAASERLRQGLDALERARLHPLLIIIRPDRPDLRPALREQFGDDAMILEDRRRSDRRKESNPFETERRRGNERRGRVPAENEQLCRKSGYRIVCQPGP